MWSVRYLQRMDLRVIPVILLLMGLSLAVISAQTGGEGFLSVKAITQLKWFGLGSLVYLAFAGFDYGKLREWAWIVYGVILLALVAVFFSQARAGVHRWLVIPGVSFGLQPSELAKLVVVLALSWFLERRRTVSLSWGTAVGACFIVGIPFLLILKQPDLGTAMVLWPISLVMFYFGGVRPTLVRAMVGVSLLGLVIMLSIFLGLVDHEAMRPYATKVLKDYQYERLNPDTYHQRAAQIAIGCGGLTGQGWKKGEFAGRGWLPAAETDSVFPSLGEEFGFIGMLLLMVLFYTLIYFGFQVTAVAKDHFGRLLSAGITVYLAMHVLTNMLMMCGLMPITGVPLILITYGGSSTLVTMAALGTLQSIFARRFLF
ncbi:MAG: rod shape-determining protein RodA [Verrucomicrobia bacterium]|nr:rod shape-determining protein RodA [Verrucomicrobiota bacterium]